MQLQPELQQDFQTPAKGYNYHFYFLESSSLPDRGVYCQSIAYTKAGSSYFIFFTPSTDYILTSDDTEPGSSGTEGAERVHSWLWTATPCIQTTFPVSIAFSFGDQEHPRSAGKQAGRKTPHMFCSQPSVSAEKAVTDWFLRGKSGSSEHCCRSGGQKNATPDIH